MVSCGLGAEGRAALAGPGPDGPDQCKRYWPHFDSADESLLETLWPGTHQDFLAAGRGKPKGQIVVQRAADIPELIALLGRYYRNENIFVVCKNRKSIRSLTWRLKPIAGRFVTRHVDQRLWRESPRMYVGSISDFSVTNPDGWQVVIFADVESATASWTLQHAAYLPCLYFGFVRAQDRLDERQWMDLESVAGPEIFRLVQEPVTFTRVRVVPVGPFAYPAIATGLMPLERKRQAMWHNLHRNRAIAELAQSLWARDLRALANYGILREHAPRLFDPRRPADRRPSVAILVESPEHGRQHHRLLRDWQLLDATSGVGREVDSLPPEFDKGIVTVLRAHRVGLAADMVIRADGMGGTWDTDYGAYGHRHEVEMLVVDIQDDFDVQAIDDSHAASGITRHGPGPWLRPRCTTHVKDPSGLVPLVSKVGWLRQESAKTTDPHVLVTWVKEIGGHAQAGESHSPSGRAGRGLDAHFVSVVAFQPRSPAGQAGRGLTRLV